MKITTTEKTSDTLYFLFIITAHIQNSYAEQPVKIRWKAVKSVLLYVFFFFFLSWLHLISVKLDKPRHLSEGICDKIPTVRALPELNLTWYKIVGIK